MVTAKTGLVFFLFFSLEMIFCVVKIKDLFWLPVSKVKTDICKISNMLVLLLCIAVLPRIIYRWVNTIDLCYTYVGIPFIFSMLRVKLPVAISV